MDMNWMLFWFKIEFVNVKVVIGGVVVGERLFEIVICVFINSIFLNFISILIK